MVRARYQTGASASPRLRAYGRLPAQPWGRQAQRFPVEAEGANVWELRDGSPVRLTVYQSRAAALAAVGLRE